MRLDIGSEGATRTDRRRGSRARRSGLPGGLEVVGTEGEANAQSAFEVPAAWQIKLVHI